jgi:hypothetical protein
MSVAAQPLYGFSDGINLSCSIAPTPSLPAKPLTCTLGSSTIGLTGSTNTVMLTISSDSSTPVGIYTVTVTAQDAIVTTLMHTTTFTVSVINLATAIKFLQGVGGTGSATVTFAGLSEVTFNPTCVAVNGSGLNVSGGNQTLPAQGVPLSNVGLQCSFNPTSVALTTSAGGGVYTGATAVTVSSTTTTSMLFRNSNRLFAVMWSAMPAFVLIRPLRRKKLSKRGAWQALLLLLVTIALIQGIGCGGNGFKTSGSSSGGALLGTYNVLVQGTAMVNGQNVTYSAVIPVDVGH